MKNPTRFPHPDKGGLRRRVLAARDALGDDARGEASRRILEQVLMRTEFVNAAGVHCYINLPGEVDTAGIFEACWDMGKTTYVPYQIPDEGRLGWAQRRPADRLVTGPMNVREPAPENRLPPPQAPLQAIDLVLAPGVAFDRQGNRMGYGKGFYDEFLTRIEENFVVTTKEHKPPPTERVSVLGLAFSVQIVDAVPRDPWDRGVDAVLTELGAFSPGRQL